MSVCLQRHHILSCVLHRRKHGGGSSEQTMTNLKLHLGNVHQLLKWTTQLNESQIIISVLVINVAKYYIAIQNNKFHEFQTLGLFGLVTM